MTTTVTKTIKPSGGDYTTLAAWESANQADLTSVDEIRQAECYPMADTATVNITGWTTDATRYIRIYAASGAEAVMPYGTGYRIEVSAPSDVLFWDEDYVRIERITGKSTATGAASAWLFINNAGAGESRVLGCLGLIVANTATTSIMRHLGAGGKMVIANSVAYSTGSTGAATVLSKSQAGSTFYCYNNLSYRCTGAFQGNSASGLFKNNIYDKADITAGSTFTNTDSNSNYNSTTEGAPGGANSRNTQTFTYVNAAGGNFHLTQADGGAKGFGVDLSGDGNFAFATDFDAASRAAPWDIGPTVPAAAAGHPAGSRFGNMAGIGQRSGVAIGTMRSSGRGRGFVSMYVPTPPAGFAQRDSGLYLKKAA